MTMFNKDLILQLMEDRDSQALRALWQGAAEPPPKGADIRRSRYLSAIFRRP